MISTDSVACGYSWPIESFKELVHVACERMSLCSVGGDDSSFHECISSDVAVFEGGELASSL